MESKRDLQIPLQLCTYGFADEDDARSLAQALEALDFHHDRLLLDNLAYHSLLSLMHLALEDLAGRDLLPSLPESIPSECAVTFHRDLVRTTLIDHHLQLLLLDCAQEGLLPVPLKGNYLSSMVYGRKEARPYRDIDILVRAEDLPLVAGVLRSSGFAPRRGMEEFLPPPYSTTYVKHLEGDRLKVDLDLHTSIHWPREYNRRACFVPDDIWLEATKIDFRGVPAMAMTPEHLVIYIYLDLAVNHRFAHLIKFRDLFEVFSRFPVDFDELAYWAGRWEVRSFVFLALNLFRSMGGDAFVARDRLLELKPHYPLLKAFEVMTPPRSLPYRRARNATPPNFVFLLLADRLRQRAVGLANLPSHLYHKLKHPTLR